MVVPHKVGKIGLYDAGRVTLYSSNEWEAFRANAEAAPNRDETILRARFSGDVTPALLTEISDWSRKARDEWLGADLDWSTLRALPNRADFASLRLERLEETVLESLDAPLSPEDLMGARDAIRLSEWSGDADARREALSLYYRLLGG